MSKISSMMDVGKRSLSNSQTSLQTVAHNIANKSTEGYSRQRVELVTNVPTHEGNLQIGMGARAAQVTRTNNPWLEKQIQKESTSLGFAEGKAETLARVEQVYNEQLNKGLNQYVTEFFNAFRELSNNPESLTSRTLVREAAHAMTLDFQRVSSQLKNIQDDIDGQVINQVEEINQMSKEIASLNQKIQSVEVQGVPANDERDRRDLLLKKLGDKIDITWAEGRDGMVSVTAGNTAILVSGISSNELKSGAGGEMGQDKHARVLFSSTENGTVFDITKQIRGGKLGAILETRDQTVEDYLNKIDKMAFSLGKEVNSIHIAGYDRYGKPGVLFFDMPMVEDGAAQNLTLNSTVMNDTWKIAAGNKPQAPGDNTIANLISSLQYQGVMNNKSDTFDDYYNSIVGQVGTIAQRSTKSFEAQKNIVSQLNNIRESVSGVSLDEETTRMIEMQKAYEASARLIKTADELFDTVLNLKRL